LHSGGLPVGVGDGGSAAVDEPQLSVLRGDENLLAAAEAKRCLTGTDLKFVGAEDASLDQVAADAAVECGGVASTCGEYQYVAPALVGIEIVGGDARVQVGGPWFDVHAAVVEVGVECADQVPIAQLCEGVAFPGGCLALIAGQADGVVVLGECGEQAASADLG